MEENICKTRIDRWLWACRVFKTRSLAVDACRSGHVKMGGKKVKPSRLVGIEDLIIVHKGEVLRTFRVKGVLERRVGAKSVPEFLEDLTPSKEHEKGVTTLAQRLLTRDRGSGRPTKKQRREMDNLLEDGGL